ncbi:endonuclease/exonuclease/phosphatase family protein [Pedobacter frigoris]|uniref:endonuclease/exonuclease/phosphatase family protein n=1 Tax=Pedobacter frigoris TaxID=2571272 RepID=UPI00292FA68F|nr:endonuclease/exonuclease/phosphatase family protein [Pedobacter frigoris]
MALHLDGADNNPCIGMSILKPGWTVEAWIKGNDNQWKAMEVIIGAGEYGELNEVDTVTIGLKNGRLFSAKANIYSSKVMDDKWHHVALTNDGKHSRLYLDGDLVATSTTSFSILPGTIGAYNKSANTFGGLIDEVRIWEKTLPGDLLKKWAYRPLNSNHPDYKSLKGYYNFDAMSDDVCLNLVGKGHQAYHMRNTRLDYKGKLPLAKLAVNDNSLFKSAVSKDQIFNAVTIQSEWDADQGSENNQILKLRIAVNETDQAIKLTALKLDLSGTTSLHDVKGIHVYNAGSAARDDSRIPLFEGNIIPRKNIILKSEGAKSITLKKGINYLLVTFDVAKDAIPGNVLHAKISSFSLNGISHIPEESKDYQPKKITVNSTASPGFLKVLQWNIWHGGVHMGNNGRNRIKELIRSTNADLITMQEAYGSQQMLADSLGFFMQTPTPSANLALFSRYPIEKLPSNDNFKANTALLRLPNKKAVLVSDWWLRYAYRPSYTVEYLNKGHDPNRWVEEDKLLGYKDAMANLEKDIEPILKNENTAVIVGGDFNSGSHLDWTIKAAPLHNGYGPVAMPISQLMSERGYTDSFRYLNPDELKNQGGTFATIFGHLQTSRIDYIYYKGNGIKVLSSKIIRSAPEIDDVWPSDHAAVLTVFDTSPK